MSKRYSVEKCDNVNSLAIIGDFDVLSSAEQSALTESQKDSNYFYCIYDHESYLYKQVNDMELVFCYKNGVKHLNTK